VWRSRIRFTLRLRIAAVEESFLEQKRPSKGRGHSCWGNWGESLAVAVVDGLGDDADVGDAGLTELVDHGGKSAKGDGFVGAQEDRVTGMFELLFDFGGEVVDVNGIVAEIDALILVDGDDEADLGDFLDCMSFGDVDFDAGLEDGCGNHEDDEEDEDDVDERHHVDLGERGLSGFGELRHGSVTSGWQPEMPPRAGTGDVLPGSHRCGARGTQASGRDFSDRGIACQDAETEEGSLTAFGMAGNDKSCDVAVHIRRRFFRLGR